MCLLIGPSGVGKTLLLKTLQTGNYSGSKSFTDSLEDVPSTIPTTGTNLVNITVHKKQEVTVREVGGSMGPIWPNYYKNANAIMYMLDLSNRCQVSAACIQLLTMLIHPCNAATPILVLLNKKDLSSVTTSTEIKWLLHLEELKEQATHKITILEVSAKTGLGLDQVARWIHDNHRKSVQS
ncbi:ADP-ribosylation factor-like protein 16 [Pomacea canaliculata]|uniref:ADP-ribosylation factor-like protein 16 n=1 Tax=Pomacea canaliculata TaxID=400727 RepID=UPI000D725CA6|nr:ADP-ribosylation factor-like protein 16 [Pomacea canaliculata]